MNSARSRSLDFLRALAIFLVIMAHSVLIYGAPSYLAPLQLGGTGVDLFFVLSGWLLGGQLIRELRRSGTVNLRRFWVRRWMRTLPPYYAVLLFTYLQQALFYGENSLRADYLVFAQNYADTLPYFAVSWSLCVEEHFYLLVAPMLLLLVRLHASWRWLLIGALMISPFVFRQLGWFGSLEGTHVRWDGCMLGVALAVCSEAAPRLWEVLRRASPWLAGIGLVVYIANYLGGWWPVFGGRDYDKGVYALIFASFVLLACRSDWWREKLYIPGAHYVALRAYALYLIHPEVLAVLGRIGKDLPFPLFLLCAWAGSLLLAESLYRLIERPVMEARESLALSRQT